MTIKSIETNTLILRLNLNCKDRNYSIEKVEKRLDKVEKYDNLTLDKAIELFDLVTRNVSRV